MDRRNFFQRAALAGAGFVAARLGMKTLRPTLHPNEPTGMTNLSPTLGWDTAFWDPVYISNDMRGQWFHVEALYGPGDRRRVWVHTVS